MAQSLVSRYSLEEQETIIRWDRTPAPALVYTASPTEAARWKRLGWEVQPVAPHGWQTTVPKKAITLRRLVHGALVKRQVSPEARAAFARRRKTLAGCGTNDTNAPGEG